MLRFRNVFYTISNFLIVLQKVFSEKIVHKVAILLLISHLHFDLALSVLFPLCGAYNLFPLCGANNLWDPVI